MVSPSFSVSVLLPALRKGSPWPVILMTTITVKYKFIRRTRLNVRKINKCPGRRKGRDSLPCQLRWRTSPGKRLHSFNIGTLSVSSLVEVSQEQGCLAFLSEWAGFVQTVGVFAVGDARSSQRILLMFHIFLVKHKYFLYGFLIKKTPFYVLSGFMV